MVRTLFFILQGQLALVLVESHCSASFEVQTWGSLSPRLASKHETFAKSEPRLRSSDVLVETMRYGDTMHSIFNLLQQQEQKRLR